LVKAHVGIVGNELAELHAKAAASDIDAKIVFDRFKLSTLIKKREEKNRIGKKRE